MSNNTYMEADPPIKLSYSNLCQRRTQLGLPLNKPNRGPSEELKPCLPRRTGS
ncbi:hypothetical protein P3X46_013370 [Hevea brasiliensis]|uniref:Uncharacterized protein n=1 Tax=Hevea brasiliensis TaxID=3981 RepID=A0ABQ9M3H9_HEVBR|nr:hypothetical protein P3X46_013370 [Hevea brasiliensis]